LVGTLDPSYKNATGDKTIEFPFNKFLKLKPVRISQTIYNAGIYFGKSTAREIVTPGNGSTKEARIEALQRIHARDPGEQQVNNRFPNTCATCW